MMTKKSLFCFLIVAIALLPGTGCGSSVDHDKNQHDHDKSADTVSSVSTNDPVITNTELKTESYSGILPCDNCDGIETALTLKSDSTFSLHRLYIGRKSTGAGSNEFSDTGRWMLHGADMIHLTGLKDQPSMYLRTDSSLIQLDKTGKKNTGKLADKYELKKLATVGHQENNK